MSSHKYLKINHSNYALLPIILVEMIKNEMMLFQAYFVNIVVLRHIDVDIVLVPDGFTFCQIYQGEKYQYWTVIDD